MYKVIFLFRHYSPEKYKKLIFAKLFFLWVRIGEARSAGTGARKGNGVTDSQRVFLNGKRDSLWEV